MKRIVCLLVIVSIAYAGCADKKPSKVTVIHLLPKWESPGDWESNAVLRLKNARLEMELSEVKNMHKQKIAELEAALESQRAVSRAILAKLEREQSEAKIMHKQNNTLLVKIDELETALELQRAEERAEKALLVRTAKLEAVLESQGAVIENLKKIHQLHETTIEYQRSALESSLKLCRLYEAKIESQGKSRSSEESPLSKEPEAGQHQGQE